MVPIRPRPSVTRHQVCRPLATHSSCRRSPGLHFGGLSLRGRDPPLYLLIYQLARWCLHPGRHHRTRPARCTGSCKSRKSPALKIFCLFAVINCKHSRTFSKVKDALGPLSPLSRAVQVSKLSPTDRSSHRACFMCGYGSPQG